MKFISLTIKTKQEGTKTFHFCDKTLIISDNNSVGKSTLLRLIFYSLGYSIPGTYKMKFKNIETMLTYSIKDSNYTVIRKNKYISLYNVKTNKLIESMELDGSNWEKWLSIIWQIDSPYVIDNLLGAIYMDQDKGWTLLNRGTVIGNIHFNIRNLLIGLSMDSDSDIYSKLKKVDEMKKVQKESRAILRLIDFSEQREKYPNDVENDMDMEKELKTLKMVRNVLNRKIKKLKNQINNDKSVLNYIDAMQLTIEHNGEVIPVTKKNLIVSQDNINFLIQQLSFLERELINTNYEIRLVKEKLAKETETLFENKDDKILDSVMSEFQNMNIKVNIIESKIDDLEEKIRSENSDIDKIFLKNNVLVKETTEWIKIFAKKLGVLDIVNQNKYLFTRDLKSISGTIYYKVVFAFKMAYIKVIEDTIGEKLPIVLDSPSGREVTDGNISIIIDIINEFFKNNQIIIASIKKYNIQNLTEIRIINNLMENNSK